MRDKLQLDFPILCDVERRVVRSYGLVSTNGAHGTGEVAIPAHLLLARDGTILWRFAAGRITERPDPAEVLAQVRRL